MSKSYKPKDKNYIDSTGIITNNSIYGRKTLKQIVDSNTINTFSFQGTPGSAMWWRILSFSSGNYTSIPMQITLEGAGGYVQSNLFWLGVIAKQGATIDQLGSSILFSNKAATKIRITTDETRCFLEIYVPRSYTYCNIYITVLNNFPLTSDIAISNSPSGGTSLKEITIS